MSQIFARRVGRIAFGVVLLAGVAWLATAAWSGSFDPDRWPGLDAAQIVGLTWLAATVACVTVRAIAARLPGSRSTEALFVQSWIIPSVGVALLLPLTVQMPLLVFHNHRRAFDDWVGMSLEITGFAHVVFAILCALRAYCLAVDQRSPSPMLICAATVTASCAPFGLAPVAVAITGLPIVPLLYAMEGRIARERAELSAIPALPNAVAVLPPRS